MFKDGMHWNAVPAEKQLYANREGVVLQTLNGYDDIREPYYMDEYEFPMVNWYQHADPTIEYPPGQRILQRWSLWQVMAYSWYDNWKPRYRPFWVNGDVNNHSIDNLRPYDPEHDRVVHCRIHYDHVDCIGSIRGKVRDVTSGVTYDSASQAALAVGGTRFGVYRVLAGTRVTHRGHVFERLD